MGLFDALFGKNVPETVTAHILDPNRGYFTQTWSVGKEVSADTVSRLAEGHDLYTVCVYDAGELKRVHCKKEMWLQMHLLFVLMKLSALLRLKKLPTLIKN